MFRDKDTDYLEFRLSTTQFLGRPAIAEQFFDLLFRYGGIYLPEKWDVDERTRRPFEADNLSEVVKEWASPKKMQMVFFHRKRPVEILMWLRIERFARAKFNDLSIYVRDKHFKRNEEIQEFLRFATELCSIFCAEYGVIAHTLQERRQSPILTPAERLPGIYWANFFGAPYIKFFGREKLLATPCHAVREINQGLMLLLTADSPYQPAMLDNDDETNRVKAYLNQNAFAGPNFPQEGCAVPQFDFSDVRWGTEPTQSELLDNKLNRIQTELAAKGYKTIGQTQSQLTLQGTDKTMIVVDLKTGSISVDVTGEAALRDEASERPGS